MCAKKTPPRMRARSPKPYATRGRTCVQLQHVAVARVDAHTYLRKRRTASRVVDDIRDYTLNVAVTFGKVLRTEKDRSRAVSFRVSRVAHTTLPRHHCPRRRAITSDHAADDALIAREHNACTMSTRTHRASPSPTRHTRRIRPRRSSPARALGSSATALAASHTYRLAVLRRAFARVGVGGEHRPFTLTAASDNATHV